MTIRIMIDDNGGMDIISNGDTITITSRQRIAICRAITGTIPTADTIRDFFVGTDGKIDEVF